MMPTRVLVPQLHTRKGLQVRRYATDLAARLNVPVAYHDASSDSTVGALCVAPIAARPLRIPTIVPMEEEGIMERGPGPVMIPLGNERTGLDAFGASADVIAALGCTVIFYHTTWKNQTVTSSDPRMHMCAEARDIMACAERLATARGLSWRSVVETAETIDKGAIDRALLEHCLLIVMARSRRKRKCSNVDQLIDDSPIPVFVTA